MVLGRLPADLRIRAGAEAAGEFTADVELDVGVAHEQSLGVGVDRDELDALETDLDHAVDGVHTATADPDDLYHRQVVLWSCHAVSVLQRHRWADGGACPSRPVRQGRLHRADGTGDDRRASTFTVS